MTTRNSRIPAATLLAVGGFTLAAYLATRGGGEPNLVGCSAGGCGSVLNSAWSHIGPIKIAWFGAALYAALAGVGYTAMGADRRAEDMGATDSGATRRFALAAWAFALAGVTVSWLLQAVAAFSIRHFCPYCFASACLMTVLFMLWTYEAWIAPGAGRPLRAVPALGLPALVAVVALRISAAGLTLWSAEAKTNAAGSNVASVNASADIRDNLLRPTPNVQGSDKAKDLLVEFGDYQCEACMHAGKPLADIVRHYPAKIRLEFRNKCWDQHQWSHQAAEAALAAGAQGKFWPMHDYLYAHQHEMEDSRFAPVDFMKFAAAIGLNVDQFKRDMDSHRFQHDVEIDNTDAADCGVNGTPTVFLVTPKSIERFTTLGSIVELNHVLAKRYGGKPLPPTREEEEALRQQAQQAQQSNGE